MKNHLPDFVKKRFKVSLDELPEVESLPAYFAEPLSFHARCRPGAGNLDVAESPGGKKTGWMRLTIMR